jgi:hypothetical protein
MITYNAHTKNLEIPVETLERVSYELTYTLRSIREIAGLPMDKYERPGPLEPADHAQRAVIEIANALGINMGAKWGNEIDLRNADDNSANARDHQQPEEKP